MSLTNCIYLATLAVYQVMSTDSEKLRSDTVLDGVCDALLKLGSARVENSVLQEARCFVSTPRSTQSMTIVDKYH